MSEESLSPIVVDCKAVSEDALRGIIENFIQREGTDYGVQEVSSEKKYENLKKQVIRGDVLIVFDPETESVTLMNKSDFKIPPKP